MTEAGIFSQKHLDSELRLAHNMPVSLHYLLLPGVIQCLNVSLSRLMVRA